MGAPILDAAQKIAGLALLFTAIKLVPHVLDGSLAVAMLITNAEGLSKIMGLRIYSLVGGVSSGLPAIVGDQVSWAQVLLVRRISALRSAMKPS